MHLRIFKRLSTLTPDSLTTADSLNAIDDVYHGYWRRLPVYSPQFNPIELGFSNIREYVRANDARAVTDPVGLLSEAFQRYSEHDPLGAIAARGNWAIYFNNRARFLRYGSI